MDRSDFLKLANWNAQKLKNNVRRDTLPFLGKRGISEKWSRYDYTPRRAVLVDVAEEFTRNGGVQWDFAAKVLRGPADARESREERIFGGKFFVTIAGDRPGETRGGYGGMGALIPTDDATQDVWIGVAERFDAAEPEFVMGKLADVVSQLHEGVLSIDAGPLFSRLFLVNLTDAIRRVEARAKDNGINLNEAAFAKAAGRE